MERQNSLALRLELIWWVVTAVVILAVLYPITSNIYNFPFLTTNIFFIILFLTFTRYIFLLKHTFLAQKQILKAIIGVLCVPILFYLINEVNFFQTYLDEEGFDSFMNHLSLEKKSSMNNYIRSEILLFGVGSIIVTILLPLRMLMSIWRVMNRGTV